MITFTVPGEPFSKARARVVNGHAYTPATTTEATMRVLVAYLGQVGKRPQEGDLKVTIRFEAGTKVRRDLDNMGKLVLDALNKRAWLDDSQIQDLHLTRVYVGEAQGRTVITIEPLEQPT